MDSPERPPKDTSAAGTSSSVPASSSSLNPTSGYIAPARVQVLLVPLHPISTARFEHFASLIRANGQLLSLGEIPSREVKMGTGRDVQFTTTPATPGYMLFSYESPLGYAATAAPGAFLRGLQMHRRTFAVLGIVDARACAESGTELADCPAQLQEVCAEHFPDLFEAETTAAPATSALGDLGRRTPASVWSGPFPAPVMRVLGFDPTRDQQLSETERQSRRALTHVRTGSTQQLPSRTSRLEDDENIALVPLSNSTDAYLQTSLVDMASSVLTNMTIIAKQLEFRASIPTPQPFQNAGNSMTGEPLESRASSPLGPVPKQAQSYDGSLAHHGSPSPAATQISRLSMNKSRLSYNNKATLAIMRSSTPPIIDSKTKKKNAGREKKLVADLWLLSGRLSEALAAYQEALSLTKTFSDQVWQASIYENMAILQILQGYYKRFASPTNPLQSSLVSVEISHLLTSVPERLTTASGLYEKVLPPVAHSSDHRGVGELAQNSFYSNLNPDRSHPLLHSEACLRSAQFQLVLWEQGGQIDKALRVLVEKGGLNRSPLVDSEASSCMSPKDRDAVFLHSLSPRLAATPASRNAIAKRIAAAHSPSLVWLSTVQRLRILSEIARIYRRIGFVRKESVMLREISSLLASIGDKAASLEMATNVLQIYGISPPTRDSGSQEHIEYVDSLSQKRKPLHRGWPVLQVGALNDASLISTSVNDMQAAAAFTNCSLRALYSILDQDQQTDLQANLERLASTSNNQAYWGPPDMVLSAQVVIPKESQIPQLYKLDVRESTVDEATSMPGFKTSDTFLFFNPNAKKIDAPSTKPLIVQNETLHVLVTLRNPYKFGVVIDNISLDVDGVSFDHHVHSVTLGPQSVEKIILTGIPLSEGDLTIKGVGVKLRGCESVHHYRLPVWSKDDLVKFSKALSLDTSADRLKTLSGLSALEYTRPELRVKGIDTSISAWKYAECSVIRRTPMASIRSTSLTHQSIVLYDGETSMIKIQIENTSDLPITFLDLEFSDSYTTSTQTFLEGNSQELEQDQIYELELEYVSKPVFRWMEKTPDGQLKSPIEPGHVRELNVTCLGKLGCDEGAIHIRYGNVDFASAQQQPFYTRVVSLDMAITVHRALHARAIEILDLRDANQTFSNPLKTTEGNEVAALGNHRKGADSFVLHSRTESMFLLESHEMALDKKLISALQNATSAGDSVVVVLDIMNVYGQPFDVSLKRKDEASASEHDSYMYSERVEPGATVRMLVPVKKWSLSEEQLAMPIPSFKSKQFVLSRSADDEKKRHLFWYRETLLNKLSVSFHEVGSLRVGNIYLRNLRLTYSMLDLLREDDVTIDFAVEGMDDKISIKTNAQSQYQIEQNDFVYVIVKITNKGPSPKKSLALHLQLGNSALSMQHQAQYFLTQAPTSLVSGTLVPNETEEFRIGACFTAKGLYQIRAIVENAEQSRVYHSAKQLVTCIY